MCGWMPTWRATTGSRVLLSFTKTASSSFSSLSKSSMDWGSSSAAGGGGTGVEPTAVAALAGGVVDKVGVLLAFEDGTGVPFTGEDGSILDMAMSSRREVAASSLTSKGN
jgi:hypothetical protein